jgi:hypothetical protein
MASKKTLQEFNKKVGKAVQDLGGIINPKRPVEMGTELDINTKAGKLSVKLHEPNGVSQVFSVFSRFDDEKKATATLSEYHSRNLNKFSGKWNHHSVSAEECFGDFISALNEII